MNYDDLRDYARESLKFDWMSLVDFVSVVQQSGPDARGVEGVRRAAAGAAQLVRDEVIVPGDIGDNGFEPWPSTPEESAARIESEADEAVVNGDDLDTGDIAWFTAPEHVRR
ncbi:hypothetical protein [Allokutzneria sp. NRRL B-24872]|uniref:hypothetical protein n=1 Tax=Allokutzneria sp. NRRL B-24872 TaxID=1137961 RepID=UPI000A38C86B|nr:hypothetical protein [Allokutzneria sp. NRRL B-24872]